MQRTPLSSMPCSIARAVDVVGEWWTPLVLRDLYLGLTRFDAIQSNLGVSRKVLTDRLQHLEETGVVERHPYQDNPPRFDYLLTEKGGELVIAVLALMAWGDRWEAGTEGPPMHIRHTGCDHLTTPALVCSCCGEQLTAETIEPEPGPGARAADGTRGIASLFARPR